MTQFTQASGIRRYARHERRGEGEPYSQTRGLTFNDYTRIKPEKTTGLHKDHPVRVKISFNNTRA